MTETPTPKNRTTQPHNDGCDQDRKLRQWTGKHGDRMQRCTACGRISNAPKDDTTPTPPPTPAAPTLPTRQERPPGTRWLPCNACGGDVWVVSPRPRRNALCGPCARAPRKDSRP